MKKQTFYVTGMTCAACSARVEKAARSVPGVVNADVNLLTGTLQVEAEDFRALSAIPVKIKSAGYGIKTPDKKEAVTAQESGGQGSFIRLIVSAVLLIVLMYFTMGHMVGLPAPFWYHGAENALVAAFLQMILSLPVVILNGKYYTKGLKALLHGSPNMDSLIAVGSGAALVYGVAAIFRMSYAMGHGDWDTVAFYSKNLYFESAAMIVTLISFGKFLEERAKGKTKDAVRALMQLRPETAVILKDGQEQTVPADEVKVGDLVVIRSGDRIPVDGIITEGSGILDCSSLTGESVPVEASVGDRVAAATVNQSGYFLLRAEKVGQDTTLQQVIHMVEQSGGSKAPIARLADKISGIFVPVVMGIALITFGIWMFAGKGLEFSLTMAISVLVISCPCALGLATPVAIMIGTGRGASMGVLFKNAQALEHLHEVDTVVLDKTGTLTVGKPVVTDVIPVDGDKETLLQIAAALESRSEHLFAKAILTFVGEQKLPEPEDFQTLPGLGVSAKINGVEYIGGSGKCMDRFGISVPQFPELTAQGKTPLYFARKDGLYLGAVVAADVLKEDSAKAVKALQKEKLQVVMLTGDQEQTAKAVAAKAGIKTVIAGVLPGEKAGVIRALQDQGKRVLMVGDGINDAPALAGAYVGMAIGAGTDIAMESADVVLMSGSLQGAANAIALSKATIRNIRQNLFWAFFYNCIGIPIAAGALFLPFGIQLSPMLGAAAMSFSSVFVVTNALRLRSFRPGKEKIKEEKPMNLVLKVEGMMCVHCKATVEKVCKGVSGTVDAVVDLQAKTVTITGSGEKQTYVKAITEAGYEVIE